MACLQRAAEGPAALECSSRAVPERAAVPRGAHCIGSLHLLAGGLAGWAGLAAWMPGLAAWLNLWHDFLNTHCLHMLQIPPVGQAAEAAASAGSHAVWIGLMAGPGQRDVSEMGAIGTVRLPSHQQVKALSLAGVSTAGLQRLGQALAAAVVPSGEEQGEQAAEKRRGLWLYVHTVEASGSGVAHGACKQLWCRRAAGQPMELACTIPLGEPLPLPSCVATSALAAYTAAAAGLLGLPPVVDVQVQEKIVVDGGQAAQQQEGSDADNDSSVGTARRSQRREPSRN